MMIDSLFNNLERAKASTIHSDLGIEKGNYGVLTLHRPSNVDDKDAFIGILDALEKIGERIPLVFPFILEQKIERNNLDLHNVLNQYRILY